MVEGEICLNVFTEKNVKFVYLNKYKKGPKQEENPEKCCLTK